jgi:hypothetical protein
MHKRLMATVAVLALGVATVLWVSANPQEKASVKPAVMKSGSSCCPKENSTKATLAAQTDKSQIKPVAAKEDGKGACPYMAGKATSQRPMVRTRLTSRRPMARRTAPAAPRQRQPWLRKKEAKIAVVAPT